MLAHTLLTSFALVVTPASLAVREDPAPKPKPVAAVVLTPVPPTHLKLAVPAEYEREGRARRWERKAANVSFAIDEERDVDLQDPKQWAAFLAKHKSKVVSRTDINVAGVPGVLFALDDDSETNSHPQRLAIAKKDGLQLTIRAFAQPGRALVMDEMLEPLLRDSVWATSLKIELFAEYPWTIATPPGMELFKNVDEGVFFATSEAQTDPKAGRVAVASVSHLDRMLDESGKTPESRIEHLRQLHVTRFADRVRESKAVKIQGRAAWELIAGVSTPSGKPQVVYMAMIAAEEYDVTMYCMANAELEATWLPRFREFVNSWKPKPAPESK